ncbi:MAG TPA: D-amino acid aminotransferase [Peptococcaceae bacterium]|nr:D-amino acid aminotransferase [Peptococcaceae bacterium]
MADLAWINGEICDLNEAKVPFLDHGYFFGYGVYEALKVYEGKPFAFEEHMDRFDRSMKEIRIQPDFTRSDLKAIVNDLILKSGLQDAMVYMQVTRGVAPRSHGILKNAKPFLTMFISYLPPVPEKYRQFGVKAVILKDDRWAHPYIKTLNLLPNVLAKQIAEEHDAYEAILVRENGYISEAASSNVFAVLDDDTIITAPLDGKILGGISRQVLIKIIAENNLKFKEEYFTVQQLKQAREVFVTNTGAEVLAVTNLDGEPVGSGKPGALTQRLYELFMEKVRQDIKNYELIAK